MFLTHFAESYCILKKWYFGSAMRTYDMYGAWNPYEHEEDVMGEKVWVGNVETESNGRRYQDNPLDIAATMRSLIKSQE